MDQNWKKKHITTQTKNEKKKSYHIKLKKYKLTRTKNKKKTKI